MIFLLFFISVLLFAPSSASAQRVAECDSCGYCKGRPVPENWNSCALCLYPNIVDKNTQASSDITLRIVTNPAPDPNNPNNIIHNRPPQPAEGKYYTQLGCIDTGFNSFRDASAAGGVLNFILNNLMFPIVGTLAFVVIIYGAFILATAQGDQFKIAQGKRMITSAIVGVLFTFGVVLIVNIIGSDILRIPGFDRGTEITFVGYGSPTYEAGKTVYPNISVRLDDKEVAVIDALKGSSSSRETRRVTLPVKLDLTNNADIQRIKLVFTNDLCLTRSNPGSCCLSASPHPFCSRPASEYYNDRNIFNYRILFDNKPCTSRKLSTDSNPRSDGTLLGNYWGQVYYYCDQI